ncbi:hypothetical protein AB7M49_001582 [Bradyrhizobium elkanii]
MKWRKYRKGICVPAFFVVSFFCFTTTAATAQLRLVDTKPLVGGWELKTYADPLTDQKLAVAYATDAKTFLQHRTEQVTAKLRVYCKQVTSYGVLAGLTARTVTTTGGGAIATGNSTLPFKDTHAAAELEFSGNVGLSRQLVRYRFDDDPVRDTSIEAENPAGGSILPLSGGVVMNDGEWTRSKDQSSEFILRLKKAARFRISLDTLPFAGPTFFDFDIREANSAMNALPCK